MIERSMTSGSIASNEPWFIEVDVHPRVHFQLNEASKIENPCTYDIWSSANWEINKKRKILTIHEIRTFLIHLTFKHFHSGHSWGQTIFEIWIIFKLIIV